MTSPCSPYSFSIFVADHVGLDATLFRGLRQFLERYNLCQPEYFLECEWTRVQRWRRWEKWVTFDELLEDLVGHDGEGFNLQSSDKHRLVSLHERFRGRAWRGVGGAMPTDFDEAFRRSQHLLEISAQCARVAFAFFADHEYSNWMSMSHRRSFYVDRYGPSEGLDFLPSADEPESEWRTDNSLWPGRNEELAEGRRVWVSSHMWLGPEFWKIAACTPEQVKAQDWLKWEEWRHGVLYIHCWPVPFNRPDGEQGQLQKKLWRLLYDKDCHWPLPDGVGGPECALPKPPPLPPVPPPLLCPYEPPQVATAVFDAPVADLPGILAVMNQSLEWSVHKGRYDVLPTGDRMGRWRGHHRAFTLDEATAELVQNPQQGIVMVINAETEAPQNFAIGVCASRVQPGKVLARMMGPVGNPRWIPYLGPAWTARMAALPGFELAWMGNVDAELGVPTPPDAQKDEEWDFDHDYLLRAMESPDRWAGKPVGSTMWFSKSKHAALRTFEASVTEKDGALEIQTWPNAFSSTLSEPGEGAAVEKLRALLYPESPVSPS